MLHSPSGRAGLLVHFISACGCFGLCELDAASSTAPTTCAARPPHGPLGLTIARRDIQVVQPLREGLVQQRPSLVWSVLEEDRPVIQSQWPIELDSSELSVSTDKISIQYRKWHRELSQAALGGYEEFKASLLTEVIEER